MSALVKSRVHVIAVEDSRDALSISFLQQMGTRCLAKSYRTGHNAGELSIVFGPEVRVET